MGNLVRLLYDIHAKVDVGWSDLGIEAPYALRWARDYEPHRWHPHTKDLTFYRLVIMRMMP